MTFEQWWAGLKNQPIPQLKPAFRECWNAAIDESARWIAAPAKETEQTQLMANALKVTPINGEMRRVSQ